jgi:hypothetical protein
MSSLSEQSAALPAQPACASPAAWPRLSLPHMCILLDACHCRARPLGAAAVSKPPCVDKALGQASLDDTASKAAAHIAHPTFAWPAMPCTRIGHRGSVNAARARQWSSERPSPFRPPMGCPYLRHCLLTICPLSGTICTLVSRATPFSLFPDSLTIVGSHRRLPFHVSRSGRIPAPQSSLLSHRRCPSFTGAIAHRCRTDVISSSVLSYGESLTSCHTLVLKNETDVSIRVPRMFKSHVYQ